jgi:hypothetical protein
MDFIFELLCDVLFDQLVELIVAIFKSVAWLCRAAGRLALGIPSAERQDRLYSRDDNAPRRSTEGGSMNHLSLTRRRRGKWRGAACVLR